MSTQYVKFKTLVFEWIFIALLFGLMVPLIKPRDLPSSLIFCAGLLIIVCALLWMLPFNGYIKIDQRGITLASLFKKEFVFWHDIGKISVETLGFISHTKRVCIHPLRHGNGKKIVIPPTRNRLTVYEFNQVLNKLNQRAHTHKQIDADIIKQEIAATCLSEQEEIKERLTKQRSNILVSNQHIYPFIVTGILGLLVTILLLQYRGEVRLYQLLSSHSFGSIYAVLILLLAVFFGLMLNIKIRFYYDADLKEGYAGYIILGKLMHVRKVIDNVRSVVIYSTVIYSVRNISQTIFAVAIGDGDNLSYGPYYSGTVGMMLQDRRAYYGNAMIYNSSLRLQHAKKIAARLADKLNLPIQENYRYDSMDKFDNIITLVLLDVILLASAATMIYYIFKPIFAFLFA
jgi:hypothetical protein